MYIFFSFWCQNLTKLVVVSGFDNKKTCNAVLPCANFTYSIIATVHMSTLDKKKDTHGCIRRSNHEIMLCLDAYKKRQIMLCKATYSFGHEKNHSNFAEFVRRKKEDWHFYFNPTGIFTSTQLFVQNHESQFCRSHIFIWCKENKTNMFWTKLFT